MQEAYPVIPGLEDTPAMEVGMQHIQHRFKEAGYPSELGMAAALRFVAVMYTKRYQFNFQDLRVGHESNTLFWAPCGCMLAAAAEEPLLLPRIETPMFDEEALIQASYAVHRHTDEFDEDVMVPMIQLD